MSLQPCEACHPLVSFTSPLLKWGGDPVKRLATPMIGLASQLHPYCLDASLWLSGSPNKAIDVTQLVLIDVEFHSDAAFCGTINEKATKLGEFLKLLWTEGGWVLFGVKGHLQ